MSNTGSIDIKEECLLFARVQARRYPQTLPPKSNESEALSDY